MDRTSVIKSPGAACDMLFSIPLLVDLICMHLSTWEICKCCLVSHDFNITFGPNIFSKINLQKRSTFKKWARPGTQNCLASNFRVVKSISSVFGDTYRLINDMLVANSSVFHNLAELRCRYLPTSLHSRARNVLQLPSILSLIERSPNLQVLELDFFDSDSVGNIQRLASTIRKKGHRLHELHISSFKLVKSHHIQWILWSSAAVQRIKFNFRQYQNSYQYNVEVDEPHLWTLAMEALLGGSCSEAETPLNSGTQNREVDYALLGSGQIFAWTELHLQYESFDVDIRLLLKALQYCPLLESLTIPGIIPSTILKEVFSAISTELFPWLQHLNLQYLDAFNFGRTDIQPILGSCTDLISVVFGRAILLPQASMDSLMLGSSHSLESVTLTGSYALRSLDIHRILSSCPRLKIFEALGRLDRKHIISTITMGPYRIVHADPVLYVQDLESTQLGNKGWICTDLETLRVCYRTCNRVKEVPVVLRQHIAKLRKLRDLRLHCNNPYDNLFDKGCVQDALREWGVLSELRTLELRGLKQLVDRKELSKTRKQWTKLEWIQFS